MRARAIFNTDAKGNSTEVDVAKALEKGGLTLADVNYVNMGFPDMISAFANRARSINQKSKIN